MSTSRCEQPELEQELLARVPRAEALGGELETHLRSCQACRVSRERLLRMRAHWDARAPSPAELGRARARFASKPKRARVVWTVAALSLALSALAAAQSGLIPLWNAAPAREPAAPARARPERQAPPPAQPLVQTDAPPAPVEEPQRARQYPAREAVQPSWQQVAGAMRAGDYPAAERTLGLLARSPDPRVRDTASLTLAEIWLERGQRERARPVLERLASSGATALVRARAAELYKVP